MGGRSGGGVQFIRTEPTPTPELQSWGGGARSRVRLGGEEGGAHFPAMVIKEKGVRGEGGLQIIVQGDEVTPAEPQTTCATITSPVFSFFF